MNPAPTQPITDDILKKMNIITPNEVEASALTGVEIHAEEDTRCAAKILLAKGVKEIVITLGKLGVLAVTESKSQMFKNYNDIKVLDTTGAGDSFNGGLVTALAEGKDLFDACVFGNAVSNFSVSKLGTAIEMPTRAEIDAFIRSHSLL